jgi:hypothetical protein
MYPNTNLSAEAKRHTLLEWNLIALEVGLDAFDRALTRHIRKSKFFPTIAELRLFAGLSEETHEAIEINNAWECALQYMRRCWHPDLGRYRDAPILPPNLDYALRQIGGFPALFECSRERLPFLKQDFANAYKLAPTALAGHALDAAATLKRLRGLREDS